MVNAHRNDQNQVFRISIEVYSLMKSDRLMLTLNELCELSVMTCSAWKFEAEVPSDE
jgi:hypothetical protein